MKLTPIGTIHSPHKQAAGTPIQSSCAVAVQGTVEVFPEYALGLRDLDGFERIRHAPGRFMNICTLVRPGHGGYTATGSLSLEKDYTKMMASVSI